MQVRPTLDPGGKQVDILPEPEYLSTIVYRTTVDVGRERFRDVLLGALRELRGGPKRVTDREFVVWFGSVSNEYGDFDVVGLPEVFLSEIHLRLGQALSLAFGHAEESGRRALVDVGAAPLLRWDHGRIVVYEDAFSSPAPDSTGSTGDEEKRSYEYEVRADRERPRTPLPEVGPLAADRHTLSSWNADRLAMFDVIADMIEATSYRSLRRFITTSCGIRVVEERDAGFTRYGMTHLGWYQNDGMRVTIRLRRNLPTSLRYVILAHELSHYLLHFPLLVAGQIAEQLSWSDPGYEQRYRSHIAACIPGGLPAVEASANYFASYLLLPAWLDNSSVSDHIVEGTQCLSRAEMNWRLLQPLFPDGTPVRSWTDRATRAAAMRDELALYRSLNDLEGTTLYEIMVAAVNGRLSKHAAATRREVLEGVGRLYDRVADDIGASDFEPDPGSATVDPDRQDTSLVREILPALRPEGPPARSPRLPLVPAGQGGRPSTEWYAVTLPHDPPRTVAEWRASHPAEAVVLYPYQDRLGA